MIYFNKFKGSTGGSRHSFRFSVYCHWTGIGGESKDTAIFKVSSALSSASPLNLERLSDDMRQCFTGMHEYQRLPRTLPVTDTRHIESFRGKESLQTVGTLGKFSTSVCSP